MEQCRFVQAKTGSDGVVLIAFDLQPFSSCLQLTEEVQVPHAATGSASFPTLIVLTGLAKCPTLPAGASRLFSLDISLAPMTGEGGAS